MDVRGTRMRRKDVEGTLLEFCTHRMVTREGGERRVYNAADRDAWGVEILCRGQWVTPSVFEHLAGDATQTPVSALYRALGESLLEAKAHYPFKAKSKLGPAVRGGTNKKADKWDCNCSNDGTQTVCDCDDLTGETNGRIVKIPLSYKRQYNKDYRAWLAKKAKKAAGAKKKAGGAAKKGKLPTAAKKAA